MTRLFALAAVGCALAASQARAEIVLTNLAPPDDGGGFFGFGPSGRPAASFTTGTAPSILNSATLLLASQGSGGAVPFTLTLNADAGGQPGAVIDTFDNNPTSSTTAFDFQPLTFNTSTALDPDTTYWLVASTPGPSFGAWLRDVPGTETGIWTMGPTAFSFNAGATWSVSPALRVTFELDATLLPVQDAPVPEPATLAIFGALATGAFGLRRRAKAAA